MNTATILLYIFFISVGALVGALIQHALDRRPAPQPPAVPVPEPASTPEPALPLDPALIPQPPLAAGEVEILRAGRALSGSAWLEMDGERLAGKESLQPEQRRRLVSMLVDLRPWLEATTPLAAAPAVPPGPVLPAVSTLKAAVPDVKEAKPVVVLKTIVEQIDEVLQARLSASPFRNRGIHLVEGPGGVVLVRDGLNKYEGIDAVPEPEIKAIIRQAVSDWEKMPTGLSTSL